MAASGPAPVRAPAPEPGCAFEREYGCTEPDWLRWLPDAVRGRPLEQDVGQARVAIDGGTLRLAWQVLPPRRIALVTLPRMAVRFEFDGVDATAQAEFLRYFDLYLQRGGG